ncbi:Flp pilus assembly protein TadB [Nocardioides thalensis]|uniref:Flp pilus assembly protein TadB n=1 Tax=Nocardioides thalensis TaxID=1914755 RepID=A0A853BU52_9ACTN|nr:type II secretion system F family protein [Nocardioides thalensis]NYI99369.1 Flp pilus assembly protein TadB [Nocardioides thalensis]
MTLLAAVAAGAAAALLVSRPGRMPSRARPGSTRPPTQVDGLLRRWRPLWALLAGAGAAVLLGGPAAPVAGALVGAAVWVVAGRVEPRGVRLRREEVRRDLPHVVALLGAALRSGAAPAVAVDLACRALPGAAADRLRPVAARLELGADPAAVWGELADDPALGPLGRTMARTHRTGAPVVDAVDRLGEDLARQARAEVEDRARAVGVRAAVPLGVCLLPAFLLLGIVPLVAGLASQITL